MINVAETLFFFSSFVLSFCFSLGDPIGPSCHTGRETCFYTEFDPGKAKGQKTAADDEEVPEQALTTLLSLEQTIGESISARPFFRLIALQLEHICGGGTELKEVVSIAMIPFLCSVFASQRIGRGKEGSRLEVSLRGQGGFWTTQICSAKRCEDSYFSHLSKE